MGRSGTCLWDEAVHDSLAPSRISAALVSNPEAAAAEDQKPEKCRNLFIDGYIFQPIAFEVQVAAGENLCTLTDEPMEGSFLERALLTLPVYRQF